MGEIFGEENFVTSLIWQKVYAPKNTARHFSEDHDYILVYACDAMLWEPNLLPRSDEANSRYINPDDDPRGPWKPSDLTARNYYRQGMYEVTGPTGKKFRAGVGRYWRLSYDSFVALNADGRVWWGEHGSNMPAQKRFLSEVQQGMTPQTLWKYEDVGHTQEAKKELIDFVAFHETENVLNSVKPTRLLQRMLQIATASDTGDIVVDFFAGSATTAHAVIKQNQSDRGNRRFITVQYPEPLPKPEPDLKAITDIGKVRLRNAIQRMEAEMAGQLPLERETPEDLGFRVFKLDRSNIKAWRDVAVGDVAKLETLFDRFESPLVEGWQREDLLVEVLLTEGFPLDSAIMPASEFTTNTVHVVTSDLVSHRLFVCLDKQVQDRTIASLVLGDEDIFICLDSALSDEAKVQLEDGRRVKVI